MVNTYLIQIHKFEHKKVVHKKVVLSVILLFLAFNIISALFHPFTDEIERIDFTAEYTNDTDQPETCSKQQVEC